MNKTQEALKMAIEALEDANNVVFQEWSIESEYDDALQACKEALAEPKREWFGLSDEEVQTIFELGHHSYKEFAKAIEAKLKEINHE